MKRSIAIGATVLGLFLAGCAQKRSSVMRPAERQQSVSAPSSPYTAAPSPSGVAYPYATLTSPTAPQGSSPGLLSPASTGKITTSVDSNNNTMVHLKADHLPPPANIDPSLTTYVVWIRPRASTEFTNSGQLKVNEDRTGELTTTTPYHDFDVVITGESTATPRIPSRFVILQGSANQAPR
jgi:hypothetical protein